MHESPTMPEAFEPYREAVYGWALRIVGNHHDALDVTQDVCVRWLEQKDEPTNTAAWLHTITRRRAIDYLRARRPGGSIDEPREGLTDDPLQRLDASELREAIAAAMQQMSAAQQQVLRAKIYDGATFAAIAKALGISVSTAKTHYVRALRHLAAELKRRSLQP